MTRLPDFSSCMIVTLAEMSDALIFRSSHSPSHNGLGVRENLCPESFSQGVTEYHISINLYLNQMHLPSEGHGSFI